jgi:hypothetical protein
MRFKLKGGCHEKSGLLNLVLFMVLLLSCPLLAQEKIYDPGYPVKQPVSESLNSQRYGPGGYGSEAEGHDSWLLDKEHYQYGKYGSLGDGTESEDY